MNTRQFRIAATAVLAAVAVNAGAAGWRNLDDAHHLGGRRASEGYLKGKVVLVDRWGMHSLPCRNMLPQMEHIWQSFKTKQFVVLGGHCIKKGYSEGEVRQVIDENALTYPIYEGAGLAEGEPRFWKIPFLYVVDETGRIVYRGFNAQDAIEALVTALTDMDVPRDIEQWRRFLDFELKELPGKAYLRLEEFSMKFPEEAEEYAAAKLELAQVPQVKELAELEKFAKWAKDRGGFGANQKDEKQKFAKMLDDAITKYAPLKESNDPRVAQEAKNAIADLKWTQAAL